MNRSEKSCKLKIKAVIGANFVSVETTGARRVGLRFHDGLYYGGTDSQLTVLYLRHSVLIWMPTGMWVIEGDLGSS